MPAAATDAARQIAALAQSAENLAQHGERETAEQIYRTILASAPYHVGALMFLAARALERGEPEESERLLERAVESDAQLPAVYQNLGVVLHINGQPERALAAFDRALALKPVAPLTLLHKGTVLEELGQPDAALVCYRNGLGELPRKARELVADPTTPVKLRALIEHGMQFSHDRFAAVVSKHIAPVAARYGAPKLARVHAAIRWLNGGAQAPAFAHALQRPDYLYIPGIEPRAFFEPSEFDWVPALEQNFNVIQKELRSVLQRKRGIDP